jgi:peptide/nickel transport system ATP-binding protein
VTDAEPLLAVRGLTVAFESAGGQVPAVRGVDLEVRAGETLALVGESGSGKSATSLAIMGLLEPGAASVGGSIAFRDGDRTRDLLTLGRSERAALRGARMAMVFQEPMTALNPVQTVGDQIGEVMRLHLRLRGAALTARVVDLLRQVEIPDPERRARAYPHELSGGMRQRVIIAMALACGPALLIADEPTTALDVTVQRQVLNLIAKAQRERGMGVLFVTHNLAVVAEIADHVAVIYGGRIVETAPVAELFTRPRHPYTRGLLDSLPSRAERGERLRAIPGAVGDPRHPPPGCAFQPRCELSIAPCLAAVPALARVASGQDSRCLRWAEV